MGYVATRGSAAHASSSWPDPGRRGWNMTTQVPELRELPAGLVLDGELAFNEAGAPHWPLV